MSQFARPTFNVEDDDDLERLQREFFANQQTPSAKVIRKSAPPSFDPPKQKKRSLFAERLAKHDTSIVENMPALEDIPVVEKMPALEDMPVVENMPTLEDMPVVENMPTLEDMPSLDDQENTYEPVMDPNPEPHVPVSKKMLDLTSLLGQVLGEIKEHDVSVDSVKAPTLVTESDMTKPARGQHNGFPKPVHRSEFKKRLEAKRTQQQQSSKKRLDTPPTVSSSGDMDENDRRIAAMTEQEIEEAREEIMSTLSPESIALLMKGLKNKTPREKTVSFAETVTDNDEEYNELIQMKQQFFPNEPMENEKLAWMDSRFLTPELREKLQQQTEENDDGASEAEKVYRKVRFDLQGRVIDQTVDIPFHQGLHHHGDEPDKAGYTLAELFYLTRSQVPSQRAMVLTTLARIIQHAKKNTEGLWKDVWTVFTNKEHAAAIYLRSALDDRHLVVLVSAIDALSALVLDDDMTDTTPEFNEFLGHVAQPVLSVQQLEKKGLNEKLTELVDRVRQGQSEQEQRDDAALAEKDLIRGLIKMNILPRIRYLVSTSELAGDPSSVERLVRLVVRMAEAGHDVCELVQDEELLDPVIEWGIVQTQWPMTDGQAPSLATVRLLTVLAQGSKQAAADIVDKATLTLRFLVTDPTVHEASMKHRAYALQLETLKLIRVLACYGYIVPTLEDLQDSVMGWLRAVLNDQNDYHVLRASTAVGLLEVLLHVAADPHKSIPAHAIDWHQPTAYLPAVMAILKTKPQAALYDTCLGYLGAWAHHIRLFPPEAEMIHQVWKAVVSTVELCNSSHRLLRYVQFLTAYQDSVGDIDVHARLASPVLADAFTHDAQDMKVRYSFWLWLTHTNNNNDDYVLTELKYGIESRQKGVVEAWLAHNLLQKCLLRSTTAEGLEPFYLDTSDVEISKALFFCDGRAIKTLMYAVNEQETDMTGFLLSPIDAFYHLDKSRVAQKCRLDAVEVVLKSLRLTQELLKDSMDHAMSVISLMKVFMIGDREGRQAEMESDEREIFWNEGLMQKMEEYLQVVCQQSTSLDALENAWRRSSGYIRQAQVPFFQFYQGFVAHYASVSFGHPGFARLLVYLVTQIKVVDYRHLVFSDYREILTTLNKIKVNEIPPLDDWKELEDAGLKLSNKDIN